MKGECQIPICKKAKNSQSFLYSRSCILPRQPGDTDPTKTPLRKENAHGYGKRHPRRAAPEDVYKRQGQTNKAGAVLEEVHIGEAVIQRLTEGDGLEHDKADDPGDQVDQTLPLIQELL